MNSRVRNSALMCVLVAGVLLPGQASAQEGIAGHNAVDLTWTPSTLRTAPQGGVFGLQQGGAPNPGAVPSAVRQAEQDVERQVRKYRVGVQGGLVIDPELVSIGVHANVGPFFTSRFAVRPHFELGFGELTTLLALNVDGIYRLRPSAGQRWTPYFGAGPSFSLSHRGFEGEEDGERFDFGDTDWETGLDLLVGFENRNGMFLEFKATPYSVGHARFIVGYSF